jgi:hypothetical protein
LSLSLEELVPGCPCPDGAVFVRAQRVVQHLEVIAVIEEVPAPDELRVGELAGVRDQLVEVVAVEAIVEVGPATLADISCAGLPLTGSELGAAAVALSHLRSLLFLVFFSGFSTVLFSRGLPKDER